MKTGRLYVAPIINAMGPVTDQRYNDLLGTWEEVDNNVSKIFDSSYRNRILDSNGNPLAISWFFVSWSGFKINPVKRDFGWFTIYDHYQSKFGNIMRKYDDGMYWMYNHPPPSGIGNEWGLDWFHNSHYFEILNRYVIEREYFPSVVQIVTEKNDASHWIDNWFPFDFSNRNVDELDLNASQEQGKKVIDVLDWRGAPTDWSEYIPSIEDYRKKGTMKRHIFRVLDIKTRIYQLTEKEIEKAFLRCMTGKDTVIAAYEHDFRDRSETIMDYFISPIADLSKKYPDVSWSYSNALNAAQSVCGYQDKLSPSFDATVFYDNTCNKNMIRIRSSENLFGNIPYVVSMDINTKEYVNHAVHKIGSCTWQLDRDILPRECIFGIASSDIAGNVGLQKFVIKNETVNRL